MRNRVGRAWQRLRRMLRGPPPEEQPSTPRDGSPSVLATSASSVSLLRSSVSLCTRAPVVGTVIYRGTVGVMMEPTDIRLAHIFAPLDQREGGTRHDCDIVLLWMR